MSRIYAQQKRPGAKATESSYGAPAAHTPSLVSGQSSSDLDALMQAKYRQHFLDNQIPTAEAEADRIAASVSGARTPEEVKTQLGEKMGADFSNVTFHTDSAALKQADAMGARAYTTGSDVYFGSGGFDPGVAAHELVHTVQQGMVGSTIGTVSAPTGGVQMMPGWLKKAGHGIKDFISPSDKSKGNIFDAPTRLINKAFGLPFKLFDRLGSSKGAAPAPETTKTPPPLPPKPDHLRVNPIGTTEDAPTVEEPIVETPVAEEPVAETPVAEPAPQAPVVQKPAPKIQGTYHHENKRTRNFRNEAEYSTFQDQARKSAAQIMAESIGQNAEDVDLGSAHGISMLKNAYAMRDVMQDFKGLHVGSIHTMDREKSQNSRAMMAAHSGDNDIAVNDRIMQMHMPDHYYRTGKQADGVYAHGAANPNYTMAHELGHVVNFDLAKKTGSRTRQAVGVDKLSRMLLADSLSTMAGSDETLKTLLIQNANLGEDADFSSAKTQRQISRRLNGSKDDPSALLQALHRGGYVSEYGSSHSAEMYAEAFAEHYRNQAKEQKYSRRANPSVDPERAEEFQQKLDALQTGRNSLSDMIVSRSQALFHDPKALQQFRKRFKA